MRRLFTDKKFLLALIFVVLLIPVFPALCDTYDDDATLEFYWDAATGSVHHYNVYLSIDDADYTLVGTTNTAPTEQQPYIMPIDAEDGRNYRLKAEAESSAGSVGAMSEPSDLVRCKLKSPGDVNGMTKGDANGDLKVDTGDLTVLRLAWKSKRGESNFSYKADLNYDDSVDLLDLIIMGTNWGQSYSGV